MSSEVTQREGSVQWGRDGRDGIKEDAGWWKPLCYARNIDAAVVKLWAGNTSKIVPEFFCVSAYIRRDPDDANERPSF